MAGKRATRPHESRTITIDERETLAANNLFRWRLAVVLLQSILGLEELELTRASGHEQEDDVAGARRMMEDRATDVRRIRAGDGSRGIATEHLQQRDRAQADAGSTQELSA